MPVTTQAEHYANVQITKTSFGNIFSIMFAVRRKTKFTISEKK